jgi:hypothetical protein
MKRKSLIFLMMLLIGLIVSCQTPTPTVVLFSDAIAPPQRPLMENITGEDVIERFKQLSANFIKAITTIEKWEEYQNAQDYYYTEIIAQ